MRTAPHTDAASRVTAQHLLQPLFVSNTALPSCTLLTICGAKAQGFELQQRWEGWLPSRLFCLKRTRGCSWSGTRVLAVRSKARRGRLLLERDGRDTRGDRCPCEHGSCTC